jgi:tetratricopeptide (TPR) repeat protein
MSHIDKALKKAQKEKDDTYKRYRRIAPAETRRNTTRLKITWGIGVAVALISVTAIVLFVSGNNTLDGEKGHVKNGDAVAEEAPASQQKMGVGAREPDPDTRMIASKTDGAKPDTFEKTEQIRLNADILYKEALDWYQKGELDKAGEGYQKVLSIEPGHAFALNNLGVIYMGRKKSNDAADMFKKAIDLKPDYVDPYYNLACLYSLSGNISKSLYYLKMAVSINNNVKNWAKDDKDLKNVRGSAEFGKAFE